MPRPDHRRIPTVLRRLLPALLLTAVAACSSTTGPTEREITLEVAERLVPCVGVGPQECMQVRERSDAPWELFYGGIEGFAYEPGFRYVLRVAQRPVPNPPADGSSIAVRLVEVMSKVASPRRVNAAPVPRLP